MKIAFRHWHVTIARLSSCGNTCLQSYIKYSQKFKIGKSNIFIKLYAAVYLYSCNIFEKLYSAEYD